MLAAEQARAFLAMALCGFFCAAAHDAVQILARLAGGGRGMEGMLDLALGAALALAVTAAGLNLRIDPARGYVFLGAALGLAVWHMTLGFALRRARYALLNRRQQKKGRKMQEAQQEKGRSCRIIH